ncbi:MAG: hypothetical protein U9N62_05015 [Thermotogota bacterium]|nr:hypothetical protein [Thermotogota bacterium]
MVSAAAQTAAIPIRRTDYDKRIQDNILSLLLRRIKENNNSSSLMLKYQRFRELLAEDKTSDIRQFDKFQKELIDLKNDSKKDTKIKQHVISNKKNNYINSTHFKRLFPKAPVLFEFSEYGVAAREILWETVEGGKKGDIEILPNTGLFKKQSSFNGVLMETYSNDSFEGFKGFQLDFYF